MGYLKYVRQAWKRPKDNPLWRERLILWRREPVTVRIPRPTRIDRARSLGYKAKPGFVLVRQRLKRGGKMRPDIKGGRRTAHSGQKKNLSLNYQRIAEERANKKHPNCEVLNSYWVAKDGQQAWYEIILIDRDHPQILKDKSLRNVAKQTNRVGRGLTSAGKKGRGLAGKGKGHEKMRPSQTASYGRKVKHDYRKR